MHPSASEQAPGRYAIALEEARRTFDEQAGQFAKARFAMGSLLGYGGVSFSVLVIAPGQLIGPYQHALLIASGIVFVALCLVVAVGMWPRKIEAGASPTKLVSWVDDEKATNDEITRNLATHLDDAYARNAEVLKIATGCNMAAIVCFSLTIILLTLRLIGA